MTMQKLRVAVVRGGNTPSYEASIASGEAVLKALREDERRYSPVDIFVDRVGIWHMRGLPTAPAEALRHVDLVWNASVASHGGMRLEQIAGQMRVPHVGASPVARALAENMDRSRAVYAEAGLPTVRHALLLPGCSDAEIIAIFRSFLQPVIVRVPEDNSGFMPQVARSFAELESAVRDAIRHSERAVVEEYMKGREFLVSVLEQARGEKLYTLLPAEIREGNPMAPGGLAAEEKKRLAAMAKEAHAALGMRHYSVSRFLVTPKSIYILETSAMPEFHDDTPLEKSLAATGWKEKDLVDHLVDLAIKTNASSL
jgi:D-alanine-D-alanine ligase